MKMLRYLISKSDFMLGKSTPSSIGNVSKYTNGLQWVKLNDLGYEDIAEVWTTEILKISNIKDYVPYRLCSFDGVDGCISENFLKPGEQLYPLGKILYLCGITQSYLDDRKFSTQDRFNIVVDAVKSSIGLDITEYLSNTLLLDALILNEDRHLYNLAVIKDTRGGFRCAPIFDNGASFLSDTSYYPSYVPTAVLVRKVKAEPFSSSFKKQIATLNPTLKIDKDAYLKLMEDAPNDRIAYIMRQSLIKYPTVFVNLQSNSSGSQAEVNSF